MRASRLGLFALSSVLVLAGCSTTAPAGGAPYGLPGAVRVHGESIPYDAAQRWSDASIETRSARTIDVFATGSTTEGGGACGPAVLRFHVVETAQSVRVLVADYQQPGGPGLACPAIGYVASAHPVHLRAPLGDRRVLDASTGRSASLLVGTDYPDIVRPAGRPSPAVLQRGFGGGGGPVQRRWTYPDGRSLTLLVQRPDHPGDYGPYGRTVRQLRIHGSPATVYATGGRSDGSTQVVWTPNSSQTLTVQLNNSPKRVWTLDEAASVARSVGGYRTVDGGRLAQPSSPGTAAASYNSADGPVRNASNLFKSSGVWIALDCEGTGHVTVTLRSTAYRFDCTDTLSHHLRKSVGDPFAVFTVDIEADHGVRWAATLARASLDGS